MSVSADKAVQDYFSKGCNCAQSVLAGCRAGCGIDRELALRVAQGFGGGMFTGGVCGAVTGAYMVIGLKYANLTGQDLQAKSKAQAAVLEFNRRFMDAHGSLKCNDLLGVDYSTDEGKRLAKERDLHKTVCVGLVRFAADAVEQVLAAQ